MSPALAIVAGVMLDKMQEAQARKQAVAGLYMKRARDLNPNTPTYLYDALNTNSDIEAKRGQNVARLLPLALQTAFSEGAAPVGPKAPQLTKPALISELAASQEDNPFRLPRYNIDFPSFALSNDPASQYAQLTQPRLLGGF